MVLFEILLKHCAPSSQQLFLNVWPRNTVFIFFAFDQLLMGLLLQIWTFSKFVFSITLKIYIVENPQSKELGRGPSGIVSTFWRKVSLCRLQRSKEAVCITNISYWRLILCSCRTSFCLFINKKILIKTAVRK